MFADLITAGTFLLICLVLFLLGDRLLIDGRRRRRAGLAAPLAMPLADLERDARVRRYSGPVARFFAAVLPQHSSEIESIQRDLMRGGFYEPTALTEYLASRNALLLFVAGMTAALAYAARSQLALQQTVIGAGVVTAMLGYSLPRMYIRYNARRRVLRIQQGLPDALDVITMCLTGGLPLQESLGRVTAELAVSHPDIAVELEIIRKQSDANSMTQALRQFAQRIDVPDVKAMSAIISQTERLGTNVSIAVREFADSLRRSYRHRAEERASKTSVKMLFPVIICLSPPVYILLCGPAILQLRNFVVKENRPGGVLSPDLAASNDPARLITRPSPAVLEELRAASRRTSALRRPAATPE